MNGRVQPRKNTVTIAAAMALGSAMTHSSVCRHDTAVAVSAYHQTKQYSVAEGGRGGKPPRAKTFKELAEKWRRETGMQSVAHLKFLHPAYLQIVGMGEDALPHIFREMREGRGRHWTVALEAITGANPASPNATAKGMMTAWLDWAAQRDYV